VRKNLQKFLRIDLRLPQVEKTEKLTDVAHTEPHHRAFLNSYMCIDMYFTKKRRLLLVASWSLKRAFIHVYTHVI